MKLYLKLKILLLFAYLLLFGKVEAQCTLTATSSGSNASYTQVYVLVNASGNIVAQNLTGTFTGVAPGTYHIHALNYNPSDAPAPLPSALIGQPLTNVGTTTAGCFNADFFSDYVQRACGTCVRSLTACETDPIQVNSSGANASYTQLYVLVDSVTNLVVATNGTGNFTGLVTAGNDYRIYALNYNPADPPSPLPTVGQSINQTGTTSAGCYNSDFLTDYLCYSITNCATSCFKSFDVCYGDNIVVSTSGENTSYTQVFVLTDAAGNFIAQNTSGIFGTASLADGATYHVHALNYNPAEAPATLPSDLSPGNHISAIVGGCYNADFMSDYVCVRISCPILMSTKLLSFNGRKEEEHNRLFWSIDNLGDLDKFVLERSNDGTSFRTVSAISPSFMDLDYTYLDQEVLRNNYYRLKLIDRDGRSNYSNVIFLERNQEGFESIRVYPNPTTGSLTLDMNATAATKLELNLYNVLGQSLKTIHYNLEEGPNRFAINIQDMAAGVYVLQLKNGAWQTTKKITKID